MPKNPTPSTPEPPAAEPQVAAVSYAFSPADDPNCPLIRRDVDDVLAMASDHGIKSTTPNDHYLSAYMWPDVIKRLYISLNGRLAKYSAFEPFDSNSFDEQSSVGDVRTGSYKNCHATCSAI